MPIRFESVKTWNAEFTKPINLFFQGLIRKSSIFSLLDSAVDEVIRVTNCVSYYKRELTHNEVS